MAQTERSPQTEGTVEVQVVLFDRGQRRAVVVLVEETAIRRKCWRPIAAIKAAAILGLPFTAVDGTAKFGFRPADKERLFGKREKAGADG